MRVPVLLVLLALLPLASAQGAQERDLAAEVRGGADVHVLVEYVGGSAGTREGASDPYAMRDANTLEVRWSAQGDATREEDGALRGSVMGEWSARASRSYVWDYKSETSTLHETTTCEGATSGQDATLQVEATPEATGLRVRFTGYTLPSMSVPGACRHDRVETTSEGTQTSHSTPALERNVPLVHDPKVAAGDFDLTVLVPYDGRAQVPFTFQGAVPSGGSSAASAFCEMNDAFTWAPGTCSATGLLRVRALVDPCPYVRDAYAKHLAALQGVPAPPAGADEQAIRAWDKPNAAKVQAVLADERAWQLVGCEGELTPDPWDAIVRVVQLKRDALLELAKQGKLSKEGANECLAAERANQLLGGSEADLGPLLDMTSAPAGTMEVRVHSPVSLHVWDAQGRHVGWDAARNAREAALPGATYAGAPGGEQTVIVPAGFYKIAVEGLDAGDFVLEVASNGTSADRSEAYHGQAQPGRTATTHYAVVDGWDGPRLEGYAEAPNRAATPSSPAPATSGAAPPAAKGTPGLGVTAAAGVLAVVAWLRRR